MSKRFASLSAYPLHWPQGFPRKHIREKSRFDTTLAKALSNVSLSLDRFGKDSEVAVTDITLSSNYTLSDQRPEDPGVAVWFNWDGTMRCVPCDRYRTIEENLQAIHHVIEARRTELRHGTLQLVRASFAGFTALPAPEGSHWREILKLPPSKRVTPNEVENAYKRLVMKAHPDTGGSHEQMAKLNSARDTALAEIGA